jgi:hypothetical protein
LNIAAMPAAQENEQRTKTMNTAALSSTRLGRMHAILTAYVERGELPGIVTLVSRRGETRVETIGAQATGSAAPMRRSTDGCPSWRIEGSFAGSMARSTIPSLLTGRSPSATCSPSDWASVR